MLTPCIRVILQSLQYKPVHIHHIPSFTKHEDTPPCLKPPATALYLASLAVRFSYSNFICTISPSSWVHLILHCLLELYFVCSLEHSSIFTRMVTIIAKYLLTTHNSVIILFKIWAVNTCTACVEETWNKVSNEKPTDHRVNLKYLRVHGNITKCILNKYCVNVWTDFMCTRIRPNDGILLARNEHSWRTHTLLITDNTHINSSSSLCVTLNSECN